LKPYKYPWKISQIRREEIGEEKEKNEEIEK